MKEWSVKLKVFYGTVILFFISLYFPRIHVLTATAPALLLISSLMLNSWRQKWALLKSRRYLMAMLLFFLWIGISFLLSTDKHGARRALDPRLPLLLFPLCLGTVALSSYVKNILLLGIALLTVLVAAICLAYGIHHSQFFKHTEFLYNDSLTEVLGQQSIYISLLVNIAIYIFAYHIFFLKSSYSGWLMLAALFLAVFSFLLASRIMMATLYLSVVVFAGYYIFKRKKYLEGITLFMGLCIGIFLAYKAFPKTFNRFKELSHTAFTYQSMGAESHYNMAITDSQWNGSNFRLAVWRCGWQLFKEAPVTGVHLGDKRARLFDVYRQRKFWFALETKKHVHNNYLDILYSLGIVGLVLFLLAWIVLPIRAAVKSNNGLGVFIILTFAAAWITEVYFDRSLGGMLTGFFIPFLLTDGEEKKPSQSMIPDEEKENTEFPISNS